MINNYYHLMNTDNLSQIDIVKKLQQRTENIRNVCVLAHVDHGKN
jgi:hypothetical protein